MRERESERECDFLIEVHQRKRSHEDHTTSTCLGAVAAVLRVSVLIRMRDCTDVSVHCVPPKAAGPEDAQAAHLAAITVKRLQTHSTNCSGLQPYPLGRPASPFHPVLISWRQPFADQTHNKCRCTCLGGTRSEPETPHPRRNQGVAQIVAKKKSQACSVRVKPKQLA